MNMRMFLSFCLIIAVMVSCKNDKKNPEVESVAVEVKKPVHTSAALEAEFNDPKVAEVYNAYNALKTALVNTDATVAKDKASALLTAYANVGVSEENLAAAQIIAESDEVEAQRTAFVSVTVHVEAMLEGALKSGAIYKQYCPMAFNNTGGYWLSNTKDIRNPYFGDVMLKCGRVDSIFE